jgi:hypothetical protein
MEQTKFDIFKFMQDRYNHVPLTPLDKQKFDPFMGSMIMSMYPNARNTGCLYAPYIRGLNSIAFHRLSKEVQVKAYESFNGQNFYRTKWLVPKTKESDDYKDKDKISELLGLSHKEVEMALSSGEINKEKCIDLYMRIYEPESFMVKKRAKRKK